ncbi:holo-[acyl-carrier-protein] synthase [bacterium]|nr:MAG: holo-[acyl-carrier-protein] synthase [bacterium]
MIYGIGIDLVKIDRMKKAVEKWGEKFLKRIFTEKEISYCFEKKEPHHSLAVRFAAKEALIKAIGSEVFVPLTDIEILNFENGKPVIDAKGKLGEYFKDKSIKSCHLSLSHEREFGIACVVLER